MSVSSDAKAKRQRVWLKASFYYISVLILLYICPHTTIYLSPYYYTSVLILLYVCPHNKRQHVWLKANHYYYMRPHTIIYVSS